MSVPEMIGLAIGLILLIFVLIRLINNEGEIKK